jgi:hypothetical protein
MVKLTQQWRHKELARMTFAPNRRVGAARAYIVIVNTEKREMSPASGWVVGY